MNPSEQQLIEALRKADAAGDAPAAQAIARRIQSMRSAPATPTVRPTVRGGAPMSAGQSRNTPEATPEPYSLADIKRGAGLTVRNAMLGAADVSGLIVNPLAAVTDKLGITNTGGINTQGAMNYYADKMGLPAPANSTERISSDASRALAGNAVTMGMGSAASGLGGVKGAVAQGVASNPVLQGVSSVTGGSAMGYAREEGASPGAQVAAGLAAGLAPAAVPAGASGLSRLILRGGESGRGVLADNIDTFARAGTTPSVGQGTERRFPRAVESGLSRYPGGAGRMSDTAEQQAAQIGTRVDSLANQAARGANPTTAGSAIVKGITGENGFIPKFKATASQLYSVVDQYFPPQTQIPVANTKAYLTQANAPIAGAPNLSSKMANRELGEIESALDADLMAQVNQAQNGTLPYEAIKALRTKIGEKIADAGISPDIPTAQLKRLYAALSQDISAAVQGSGNRNAAQALNRAENYYRSGMARVDRVQSVVEKNGGTEKVFNAALSGTKDGATTINAVMKSLDQDGQRMVAAAVLRRMGRANPGNQDDIGEVFSSERFLTNWNTMDKQARGAIFNRMGSDYVKNLDSIAKVASNIRQGSKVFANPSGTSAGVAQISAGGAFLYSLVTGQFGGAGLLAGSAAGANLSAKLMTNPKFVGWLAKQTQLAPGAVPSQIAVLSRMAEQTGDPDLQEAAQAYQKALAEQGQK